VAAAGWYPDPSGRHEQRYFDGDGWTEHAMDGDAPASDPVRAKAWMAPDRLPPKSAEPRIEPTPPEQRTISRGEAERLRVAAEGGAATSATKSPGCGAVLGVLVLFAVVIGGCISLFGDDDATDPDSSENLEFGAFDVCTEFVKDRLKAPSTAKFRNYFEDDGEVVVTGSGDVGPYTVRSTVDAENSFGASLRMPFTCVVTHTPGTSSWQLTSLDLIE
jgi:hypothetical protein